MSDESRALQFRVNYGICVPLTACKWIS